MDEMRARQLEGMPIQTQSRDTMRRGMRPNLTDQINTYGNLAEGAVEVLEEIPHPTQHHRPTRVVLALTAGGGSAGGGGGQAPRDPAPTSAPQDASATVARAPATAPAPHDATATVVRAPAPAPAPQEASATVAHAPAPAPAPQEADATMVAPAHAAHVQQVTVVVHTTPQPHGIPPTNETWGTTAPPDREITEPQSDDDLTTDIDDEPPVTDSSPCISIDDATIEELIREGIAGATVEGPEGPEGSNRAIKAAIAKFRKLKHGSKRGRTGGHKRNRPSTTSPAEPARETVDAHEDPSANREVAPCM